MGDEDEYGYGSRFTVLRILFEYGQFLLVPLAIAMAVTPLVLYLVARSRVNRDAYPDQQLGLKFALAYFKTVSFHALLVGVVMLVFSILMKGKDKSDVYRPAFGLIVPAAIVLGVHVFALRRTNQDDQPMIVRLFGGWSLVISGAVGMAGLFLVSQSIFQKGSSGEIGRLAWSLFLVYGSAWTVQAARFYRQTAGSSAGVGAMPYYPPPPGAMPPGPMAPGALAPDPFAPAAAPVATATSTNPFPPGPIPPPTGPLGSPFAPASPFAPPHPGYAPPPESPFAPPVTTTPAPAASPFAPGPTPTPASAASPFVPPPAPTPAPAPAAAPFASPFAPASPSPSPSPGATQQGMPAAAKPTVPIPAPMARPLAPPGSAPSSTPPPGSTGGSGSGSGSGGSSGKP